MRNCLLLPLILLFCIGCFPSFENNQKDKLYLKEIKFDSIQIDWYFYSSAYANFPDYITIKSNKESDTICISDNIADINVIPKDRIVISFFGSPKIYTNEINIVDSIKGYEIICDTNHVRNPNKFRKFYQKEK